MRLELACDLLTGFMSSLFLFDSEKKSLNCNKIKYYFTYVWLEDLKVLLYYFPSHFLLIITSFTDVLYASLFVIVYSYPYTIQSPNTALLSCLLWTLGIVIHLYTQYTSCLLWTLAVWSLAIVTRNLAVPFCNVILTYLVTGYGPWPLDSSQTSY